MHKEGAIRHVDNLDVAEGSQLLDELVAMILIANVDGHIANDVISFEPGDIDRTDVSAEFTDLGSDSA